MNARPCDIEGGGRGQPGDPGLTALLGQQGEACLLIDPARATIEAANAAARALLSYDAGAACPMPLDSAMPALLRLRQISSGSPPQSPERLNFWSAGRLVMFAASISKVSATDGRTLLLVQTSSAGPVASTVAGTVAGPASSPFATPITGHVTSPAPPPPPSITLEASPLKHEPDDDVNAPPPVKRDDGETLREIARRIREGHMSQVRDEPVGATQDPPRRTPDPVTKPARQDEPAPGIAPEFTWPSGVPSGQPAATGTSAPRALPPRQPSDVPDAHALAKIAHELKTPLSAIVAASEIMRDERLGPMGNTRYLGYAGDIHESARHALNVINAMLTGGQREARTIEAIDLNELASVTVSAMTPLARASDITLEADCENGRIDVSGDATAIRQIIFNLVSNALKFTPAGGDVRVVTGYLPNGTAYLVVRDTGDGMSEEAITRAFYGDDALGSPGTSTGPRPGGGYGIGLPMVRHLAETMDATIDIDSAPAKGTVVLISFPRRHALHT
ncbi:MAG: HAMP domain-containing sensor histidine kinase [Hyphomicrobium sp.]